MTSLRDLYLNDDVSNPPLKEDSKVTAPSSLRDYYLSDTPASTPPPSIPDNIPTPEKFEEGWKAQGGQNYQQPSLASKSIDYLAGLPVEYADNIKRKASEGIGTIASGLKAGAAGKPAEATGKVGLGLISWAAAPITGLFATIGEEAGKALPGTSNKDIPRTLSGNPSIPENTMGTTAERTETLLGSGLPVAKAGSMAVKALPGNKALTAIIDTIGGPDKIKPVVDELKSNPRLTLMDVVPATKRMAQKLVTTEGQHQNKFEKFVTDRIGSAKDATTDIYDIAMGTPVNIVDKVNSLKQAAADVGKNQINPAIKSAGPVDISEVISNIDAKLKPGINSVITAGKPLPLGDIEQPLVAVRKFLTDDKSVRSDANSLHQFQSALRAKAEDWLNSTDGATRQKGYALMDVRNDIVNAIDKASSQIILPDRTRTGVYKQALSNFRDEKQVENAFNMGMLVTRNKLGRLEDTPEFWDTWVKSASKEELEAAKEGARLAVQHQIAGFKAGARKGQDIVESEFNKDKLSLLFGKEEINQMTKQLKDERNIAETNSDLIKNSQTAMRQKADSRVDLPTQKANSLLPVIATGAEIAGNLSGVPGTGLLVAAAHYANTARFKYATLPLAKARNERITDLLTATGEDRDALIKILESKIPQSNLSLGSKARLALPFANP